MQRATGRMQMAHTCGAHRAVVSTCMRRATGRMQMAHTSCRKPSACDSDAAAEVVAPAPLVVAGVVAGAVGGAASRAAIVEVGC